MIRVIVCSPGARDRVWMRSAIARAAEQLGIVNIHIVFESNPEDVAELMANRRQGYLDLLACRIDDALADRVMKAIGTMRESGVDAHVLLVSSDDSVALQAYELGAASGYSDTHPVEDLIKLVSKPLKAAVESKRRMLALKGVEGLENIPMDEVLFVESHKKGLLVHLSNGEVKLIRGTMRGLFERLQVDDRFVRAGSSFLVNLDNVRSLGQGSVIFPDGESIIVPVRVRTPMKQALAAYREGTSTN